MGAQLAVGSMGFLQAVKDTGAPKQVNLLRLVQTASNRRRTIASPERTLMLIFGGRSRERPEDDQMSRCDLD